MKRLMLLATGLVLAACSGAPAVAPTEQTTAQAAARPEATNTVAAATETPTAAASPTEALSATPSPTNTPTATTSPTYTATATPSATHSPTVTATRASTPTATSPAAGDSSLLDFGAIAGQWEGEAREQAGHVFWIEVTFSAGAEPGASAGTVTYGLPGSDVAYCLGPWLAVSANDPVYEVREEIGSTQECPHGTVRLRREGDNTLRYHYTPDPEEGGTARVREATGVLRRAE